MATRRVDTGDGDYCPLNSDHGRMLFQPPPSQKQYCPHQSHDGRKDEPQTRAFWPKGSSALAEAVAGYKPPKQPEKAIARPTSDKLPDLGDIEW